MTDRTAQQGIAEICSRRDNAIKRLHKGLTDGGVTDPLRILSIVTSFMSIDKLEWIAEFQDRGKG